MELAARNEDIKSAQLWSDVTPPTKIGGKSYQGHSQQVQVMDTTYQQKTHVFGEIAPTRGGTWDGYGAVYGGGGSIQSRSESVVLTVYKCEDGSEHSRELPSSLSPRAGGLFQFDWVNGHLICARNVSGKQAPRQLLGTRDFIPEIPFKVRYLVLAIVAAVAFANGALMWAAAAAILPGIYLYRTIASSNDRKELGVLMQSVMSGRARD